MARTHLLIAPELISWFDYPPTNEIHDEKGNDVERPGDEAISELAQPKPSVHYPAHVK